MKPSAHFGNEEEEEKEVTGGFSRLEQLTKLKNPYSLNNKKKGSGLIVSETNLNKTSLYQIKVEDLSLNPREKKYEVKDDLKIQKNKLIGNDGEKNYLSLLNIENAIKDSSKASKEENLDKIEENNS